MPMGVCVASSLSKPAEAFQTAERRHSPSKQIQSLPHGIQNDAKAGLKSLESSPRNGDYKRSEEKAAAATELAKIQATSAAIFRPELLATKCAQQPQTELVVQFVDFSSKYGLGYKLSNGSYGVLFNDSTKIITHPNLFHFDYIDRQRGSTATGENQEVVCQYNFFEFPEAINKKVVLLQHFKSYLDGN